METIEYQERKIHKWTFGPSTYLFDIGNGCRLMSWYMALAGNNVREVIYWPENPKNQAVGDIYGGNPILFPFAGRCHVDGKTCFLKDPVGQIRPIPQHGFARHSPFELTDIQENRFTAKLLPCEAAKEAYPFSYTLTATYILQDLGFSVELGLTNHDKLPIPWSPGHHFYFTVPWHEGLSRSDYRLHLPAKRSLRHLPDGSLQPEALEKKKTVYPLDDPALLNRIHLHLESPECSLNTAGGEEPLYIRFLEPEPLPSARSIVTWAPGEGSPYYCVEPWMGPPNSPSHRNGLQFINPGQTSTFTVAVSLI
jgi:galactose mutarotase-like enzyme